MFIAEEPLKGFQLWFAENKLSVSQVQGYEDDSAIQSSGLQVTQYFCRIMGAVLCDTLSNIDAHVNMYFYVF